MKKKCGIITLHNVINYGAFLQAFALQTTLQNYGYEAEIINLNKSEFFDRLMQVKCKYPMRAIYNYKLLRKFDKVAGCLNVTKRDLSEFDTIIIGSDELWNLANSFEHKKEYFGEGINSENIIAYALALIR